LLDQGGINAGTLDQGGTLGDLQSIDYGGGSDPFFSIADQMDIGNIGAGSLDVGGMLGDLAGFG
jgi:hypothetical protein